MASRRSPRPGDSITTAEYRAAESEASLQSWVIEYARAHGWRVAHFRPAQTAKGWRTPVEADGKGFPDLVLVRDGIVILAEVKSQTGPVRPEQRAWLEASGAYLWRPSDRPEIERVLA